ncbi:MAG: signal peptidase I [Gemmatimonadota bacterium]|nr:signal peptidase I [Gemmatimonadota bacterium]
MTVKTVIRGGHEPTARFLGRRLLHWVKSVTVAFFCFLLIRATVVEAFRIPTASMEGTLLVGDFLLVSKIGYGLNVLGTDIVLTGSAEPARGEIIIFRPPHEPEKNYVKRIVGVPGDTIEMRDKSLFRNNIPVLETYARKVDGSRDAAHPDMKWQSRHSVTPWRPEYRPTRDNWGPIVVPNESYFVLGDNREISEDSRYWGFVTRDGIRGRPWLVYYSSEPKVDQSIRRSSKVRWNRIGMVIR